MPGSRSGISAVLHTDLLQHLTHDHFDVLVVDLHTLQTVHSLYLLKHVILHRAHALDLSEYHAD